MFVHKPQISRQIDEVQQAKIKSLDPAAFQLREGELLETYGLVKDQVSVSIEVGNYHEKIVKPDFAKKKENSNEYTNHWTAFVRIQDLKSDLQLVDFVKCVDFKLPPSFRKKNAVKIYTGKCNDFCKVNYDRPDEISLSYRGWDGFAIPITLHFLDEFGIDPMIINHRLNFG